MAGFSRTADSRPVAPFLAATQTIRECRPRLPARSRRPLFCRLNSLLPATHVCHDASTLHQLQCLLHTNRYK